MLAPLLALVVRSGDAWSGLRVEDGEVLVQITARDAAGHPVPPKTDRTAVHVTGPVGPEPARLVAVSFKKDWNPQPMAVRVERGPRAGWREVTIDGREAVPGSRFPGGSVAHLRYYLPATDTADADRALRSRLLGKPVWILGAAVVPEGFGKDDADQIGWDPRLPATVVGVERLARPLDQISSADCWDLYGGWSTVDFYAANPLAIRLRLPTHGRLRLLSWINDAGPGWAPDRSPGSVAEATVHLADPWQISRLLWPSPEPVLKAETTAIQGAFAHRRIVGGMPRSLVARVLGDPEAGAPYGEVWRRRSWEYRGSPPFSYQIDFDASGRVSGAGLQGQLP